MILSRACFVWRRNDQIGEIENIMIAMQCIDYVVLNMLDRMGYFADGVNQLYFFGDVLLFNATFRSIVILIGLQTALQRYGSV